jgi:predicted transcriptional regulator
MTVTIELSPDIEAALVALAKAQGLAVPQYVQRVLEERVSVRALELSPAERAAAWRSSADDLPLSPPLSEAAISRDSIYGARG